MDVENRMSAEEAIEILKHGLKVKSKTIVLIMIDGENKYLPDWEKVDDATFDVWNDLIDQALDFIED